jgi:SAM-dependent methyltransferase
MTSTGQPEKEQREFGTRRSIDQLREHYEVEKELAARLRRAGREERLELYSLLYDELFRRVPHHPQLTRKVSRHDTDAIVAEQYDFLARFLPGGAVFMEIGAGDCALSLEVAKRARHVYAIDVSAEVARVDEPPENFELIISDGCSIPVPPGSVDLAYSNQVMEHLHEDDAVEQLKNIYGALGPGGAYVLITPNRLSGPHDISKYFDSVASGFHLKEYTTTELGKLLRAAGFSSVTPVVRSHGRCLQLPLGIVTACERLLTLLPHGLRRGLARRFPLRRLLGTPIVARK